MEDQVKALREVCRTSASDRQTLNIEDIVANSSLTETSLEETQYSVTSSKESHYSVTSLEETQCTIKYETSNETEVESSDSLTANEIVQSESCDTEPTNPNKEKSAEINESNQEDSKAS